MATKENKREYIISNRIMTVVILCFAVLLALIFISRGYNLIVDTRQATVFLVNSLVISVPSVLLAGALLYFFNQRRKKEKKDRVFSANFVLSLAVLLFSRSTRRLFWCRCWARSILFTIHSSESALPLRLQLRRAACCSICSIR